MSGKRLERKSTRRTREFSKVLLIQESILI